MRSNDLDVVLLGQLTADEALENASDLVLVGEKFYQQQYAIATPRGSTLVAQLNTALGAVQSDGAFVELVKLYLRDDPEQVTPVEDAAIVDNSLNTESVTPPTVEPCIDGMTFIGDLNLDDQNMSTPPIIAPGQGFPQRCACDRHKRVVWLAVSPQDRKAGLDICVRTVSRRR